MSRIKRCVKSKNAVKKLPLAKPYVPDQYKTKEMCDKAIIGNGGILGFIPDCYKNQKTCGKAVGNSSHAFRFVRRRTVLQNTKILTTFFKKYQYTMGFFTEYRYWNFFLHPKYLCVSPGNKS